MKFLNQTSKISGLVVIKEEVELVKLYSKSFGYDIEKQIDLADLNPTI